MPLKVSLVCAQQHPTLHICLDQPKTETGRQKKPIAFLYPIDLVPQTMQQLLTSSNRAQIKSKMGVLVTSSADFPTNVGDFCNFGYTF